MTGKHFRGAKTTNVLTKITGWLAGIFFALTFFLSVLYAHRTNLSSVSAQRVDEKPGAGLLSRVLTRPSSPWVRRTRSESTPAGEPRLKSDRSQLRRSSCRVTAQAGAPAGDAAPRAGRLDRDFRRAFPSAPPQGNATEARFSKRECAEQGTAIARVATTLCRRATRSTATERRRYNEGSPGKN